MSGIDMTHQGRLDRFLKEWEHDTYKSKSKLPEPTVCPECGAIFKKGRWQWSQIPVDADAHEHICPACARIQDQVPAGYLSLSGDFLEGHKEEILHLIRNIEEREKKEHALKRIMNIEEQDKGMLVTFTDPHLAHEIGHALHSAYKGELVHHYAEEDRTLRVDWNR